MTVLVIALVEFAVYAGGAVLCGVAAARASAAGTSSRGAIAGAVLCGAAAIGLPLLTLSTGRFVVPYAIVLAPILAIRSWRARRNAQPVAPTQGYFGAVTAPRAMPTIDAPSHSWATTPVVVPPSSAAPAAPAAATTPAAGWYRDPWDGHQQRYWDGAQWTAHVAA